MSTEAELVELLRNALADDDPAKNILDGRQNKYTDAQLKKFLQRSLKDINSTPPKTDYTYDTFDEDDLLVDGATIFALMATGLLELRNNITYNDAGLALDMFNKSPGYQGWAGFLLQLYVTDKADFKRGILGNSFGAGFYGIRSQCSADWGYNT